uniref:Uncharacterized protein n=1 Tax=Anguilla anguilla TaxID=7936 RepID=A0A0E9UN43_ANGAN
MATQTNTRACDPQNRIRTSLSAGPTTLRKCLLSERAATPNVSLPPPMGAK